MADIGIHGSTMRARFGLRAEERATARSYCIT